MGRGQGGRVYYTLPSFLSLVLHSHFSWEWNRKHLKCFRSGSGSGSEFGSATGLPLPLLLLLVLLLWVWFWNFTGIQRVSFCFMFSVSFILIFPTYRKADSAKFSVLVLIVMENTLAAWWLFVASSEENRREREGGGEISHLRRAKYASCGKNILLQVTCILHFPQFKRVCVCVHAL